MKRIASILIAAFAAAAASGTAWADPVTWDGDNTSDDWHQATNWSDDLAPSAGKNYLIDSTAGGTATTSSTAFAGDDLRIATNGVLKSRNGAATASGTLTFAGGTFDCTGWLGNAYALTATGGFVVEDATTSTMWFNTGAAQPFGLTGAISGAGTLDKTGAKEMQVNTASPGFTGILNVNEGTVRANNNDALLNANVCVNAGAALTLFSSAPTLNHLSLDGGGVYQAFNNAMTLGGNIAVLSRSYIGRNVNQTVTLNVALTGSTNLVFQQGTTYSASVQLGPGFDGSGFSGAFEFESGSSLNLNGNDATIGGLASTDGYGTVKMDPLGGQNYTRTLTLKPPAGTTYSFSGLLADGSVATERLALAVDGAATGTQALTGASTYTGGTTVSGGKLVAGHADALGTSGTITVNSGGELAIGDGVTFTRAVTFAAGSRLGGKGTFAGDVSGVGVDPGLSVGTLTVDGNLTLAGTSTFEIEGTAAGEFDVVRGTAGKTVALGGTLELLFNGMFSAGDSFLILDFDGYSGDFGGMTVSGLAGLTAGFNKDTGVVTLTPEPATLALLATGLAGLGLIRRRRRA